MGKIQTINKGHSTWQIIRQIKIQLVIFVLWFLVLALGPSPAYADDARLDTNTLGDSNTAEQVIQQGEKINSIAITERVADSAIAARIGKILETSEWFDSLKVSVMEGIVILEGTTAKKEYRQWAETIATRTQGVVAVINKLILTPGSESSLTPVIDEGRDFVNRSIAALPIILSSLLVLIVSLFIAKTISRLSYRVFSQRIESTMLRRLIARISAVPFLIIGIYIILNITGLGALAATVIGGTGLLGLIIGFAFRDIMENFLASILISIQRPFRLGDTIKVLNFVGVVQAVTTRGTIIMTLEGNHVQIPNTTIYKEAIVNLTANPNIRLDFTVGIGYDASIAKAQAIALQILLDHPAVLNHPESWVLAESLSASTVILRLYFWVDSKTHNILKVRSAVIRIVKSAFMQHNISMPDDAREVIFPQGIHITQSATETSETMQKSITRERKFDITEKTISPGNNNSDTSACTTAEGELTTDVPMIKEQANHSSLGEKSENLLK